MAVLALLGNLAALDASAKVGFICTKGMVEAGPACPLCHGTSDQGPSSCCTWVVKDSQLSAAAQISRLASKASDERTGIGCVPASPSHGALLSDRSDPTKVGLNRASPRLLRNTTPTILRL